MSENERNIAIGKDNNLLREIFNKITEKPYQSNLGEFGQEIQKRMAEMLNIIKPFAKVETEAAKMAKSLGLASKSILDISRNMVAQNKAFSLSMNYGVSNQDILSLQSSIMSNLGRNLNINDLGGVNKEGKVVTPNMNSAFEDLIAAGSIFEADTVTELVTQYDKLGISMKSAGKATGKLYKEAGEYGLNLKKYTQNFVSNLDMAQRYNFRNGVEGVREMARKATEVRQNMQQVASFAEKVGTVTGAVETAANLQVLGGAFTQLANPLAMLNESLTDMGSLQDRLNKMAKGAAYYDSTTHQVKMDPYTRMRMKAAASAMGIDPNNFLEQAFTEARRGEIMSQMEGYNFQGNDKLEKLAKLLPNIGQIDEETGIAGATVNGEFVSLDKLTESPELLNQLLDENISEEENIREIAKSVLSIEQRITGREYQLENAEAVNKITPGVAGISTYNQAREIILNDYNEKLIEGVRKIDFADEVFTNYLNLLGKKAIGQLGQVIDASSFKELEENINKFIEKNVPEEEIRDSISNIINKTLGVVHSVTNITSEVFEEAGIGNPVEMVFRSPVGTIDTQASPATQGATTNANATAKHQVRVTDRELISVVSEIKSNTENKPTPSVTTSKEESDSFSKPSQKSGTNNNEETAISNQSTNATQAISTPAFSNSTVQTIEKKEGQTTSTTSVGTTPSQPISIQPKSSTSQTMSRSSLDTNKQSTINTGQSSVQIASKEVPEGQIMAYTTFPTQAITDSVMEAFKNIANSLNNATLDTASIGNIAIGNAMVDNIAIDNIIQSVTGNANQPAADIVPNTEKSTRNAPFVGNPETMISIQVSPSSTIAQTERSASATRDVNVNVNFGGNSTLTVVGDNGKIGKENLGELVQKWFENNRGAYKAFVESITKEIASQQ